jgi:hypothetical protein
MITTQHIFFLINKNENMTTEKTCVTMNKQIQATKTNP